MGNIVHRAVDTWHRRCCRCCTRTPPPRLMLNSGHVRNCSNTETRCKALCHTSKGFHTRSGYPTTSHGDCVSQPVGLARTSRLLRDGRAQADGDRPQLQRELIAAALQVFFHTRFVSQYSVASLTAMSMDWSSADRSPHRLLSWGSLICQILDLPS